MRAIVLNFHNICVQFFSFVLLLSAILVATLQKGVSKLSTLFASTAASSLPFSPPSATIEPEQLIKMGEDIKAVIADHTFIYAWFIIFGILGCVVLIAVLALLAQSVVNVVGAMLAVLTPVESEFEPAGGHDGDNKIDTEGQDKDKEEIAKLKGIIQKQAIALEESKKTTAAKNLALVCKEEDLTVVEIEVKKLKGIVQQQQVILQKKTETIAAKVEDLARAKLEVKKLNTLLRRASAMKTGAASLGGAHLDAKYERPAISNFIILMPPGYTWNAFQTAYANLMKELGERTTTSTERSEYHRIYQKANGMA